jgi:hypothetical protein
MKDKYRVFLTVTLIVDGESFEDVEFKTLNAFANSRPKEKFIHVENMSVDAMDEL